MNYKTYEDFLTNKDSLTFDECQAIYNEIITATKNIENKEIEEQWDLFLNNAFDYSKIRSNWNLLSREEKQQKDEARTAKHNETKRALEIFSRLLKLENISLPLYEDIKENRKQVGDFANYISYVYAINAR